MLLRRPISIEPVFERVETAEVAHRLWRRGPVPPGAAGITFGSLVICRAATPSAHLLRHEAVHVLQWRRHGIVGFLRRYLVAYARGRLAGWGHRGAYRRIHLEVEADWRARTEYILAEAASG
jgi:hypothetical protein